MPKVADEVTPIRGQYLEVKRQHPDAIVFFRLGDFYETFDADAELVAGELDIVLTSRNVAKGQRIPMAGVPYHAAEGYIARLIAKGYRVAICEQVSRQPVNGLMPREVVRVVTPGTVMEPALLAEKRNNYLAAAVIEGDSVGIAHVEITTGEFAPTQLPDANVSLAALRELDRLAPAEVLLSDGGDRFLGLGEAASAEAIRRYPFLASLGVPLTLYEDWRFELGNGRRALLDHFGVSTLEGYGCAHLPLAVRAAGALVQYLREHQTAALAQLAHLATYAVDAFMALDVATRRNLEISETIRDRALRGSLLWVLDQTLPPMGGRRCRRGGGQRLLDLAALEARLTAVDVGYRDLAGRTALRGLLRGFGDLERLANRVVQGIAGPRDLVALRGTLEKVAAIAARVAELSAATRVPSAASVYPLAGEGLDPCPEVTERVAAAVVDDPPATLNGGGFIRPGYSAELDGIEHSVREAKQWVAGLERVERERTGIKSLKVATTRCSATTWRNALQSGSGAGGVYPQANLVNAERFITQTSRSVRR
jgi:DNA mismatch repair protein MutS